MAAGLTQAILRFLDRVAPQSDLPDETPEHLRTGRRGEEDAYFYLRRRGYTMIAANYRSPNYRGEIDLVGWDGGVLCFIEVKTRTTRAVKPAEAAVDREKQKELRLMARDFLRHMPKARHCGPRASALRKSKMGSCGGSMCSPCTTIEAAITPHSSYFKMRFPWRTIEILHTRTERI